MIKRNAPPVEEPVEEEMDMEEFAKIPDYVPTFNRLDFLQRIHEKDPTFTKRGLNQLFDLFFGTLQEMINDNAVKYGGVVVHFRGFGAFRVKDANPRFGFDMHKNEKIEIPAHKRLGFIPSKTWKKALQGACADAFDKA